MGLGRIDTFLTKLTFKYFLLKNAYTKDEFEELVAHTNFREYKIPEDSIGMEIWLEK